MCGTWEWVTFNQAVEANQLEKKEERHWYHQTAAMSQIKHHEGLPAFEKLMNPMRYNQCCWNLGAEQGWKEDSATGVPKSPVCNQSRELANGNRVCRSLMELRAQL